METSRVNITLPLILKEHLRDRASIVGISLSRYLSLLIARKNKESIIVPESILDEAREIVIDVNSFRSNGGFKDVRLNEKLDTFIQLYSEMFSKMR